MRLNFLQPLLALPGPFVTVYLDVTRASENAAHELELRWRGLREQLTEQDVPVALLAALPAAEPHSG